MESSSVDPTRRDHRGSAGLGRLGAGAAGAAGAAFRFVQGERIPGQGDEEFPFFLR